MDEATKIFTAMAEKETELLHNDIKYWIVSKAKNINKIYRKLRIKKYDSLNILIQDIKANKIKNGQRVIVKCKPSLFGPYLRSHFLSAIIGNHTNLRLGPPIVSENPILGMMAQITSHLVPVGMYPSIDESVVQACLYSEDTTTTGFMGLFPGVNEIVITLPALISSKYLQYFHTTCHINGVIRMIDLNTVTESGFKSEEYEELRQKSKTWFFDATDPESECTPVKDENNKELWGGLYASGHIEISDGQLDYKDLLDNFVAAIESENFTVNVDQNQAGRKEFLLYGKGIRMCVDTQYPIYSLHMDANLGTNYSEYKKSLTRLQTIY